MIAGVASACCHLRYPYFCATPLSLFFFFYFFRVFGVSFLFSPFSFVWAIYPVIPVCCSLRGFLLTVMLCA